MKSQLISVLVLVLTIFMNISNAQTNEYSQMKIEIENLTIYFVPVLNEYIGKLTIKNIGNESFNPEDFYLVIENPERKVYALYPLHGDVLKPGIEATFEFKGREYENVCEYDWYNPPRVKVRDKNGNVIVEYSMRYVCVPLDNECSDSDGGLNYYKKGVTTEKNIIKEDYCYDVPAHPEWSATFGEYLVEFYCEDGYLRTKEIKCPNGCYEGACISEIKPIKNFKVEGGYFVFETYFIFDKVYIDETEIKDFEMRPLGGAAHTLYKVPCREGKNLRLYSVNPYGEVTAASYDISGYKCEEDKPAGTPNLLVQRIIYTYSGSPDTSYFKVELFNLGSEVLDLSPYQLEIYYDYSPLLTYSLSSQGMLLPNMFSTIIINQPKEIKESILKYCGDKVTVNIYKRTGTLKNIILQKELTLECDITSDTTYTFTCGDGNCEDNALEFHLMVNEEFQNTKEFSVNNVTHSLAVVGCIENATAIISIDGVLKEVKENSRYEFNSIPVYVNSISFEKGMCYVSLVVGENKLTCPEDCEEPFLPPLPISEEELTTTEENCNGCLFDSKCIPYGTRIVKNGLPSYCDIDGEIKIQKEEGATCQNNYECQSNYCSNGVCINIQKQLQQQTSMLRYILELIKKIFGFLI